MIRRKYFITLVFIFLSLSAFTVKAAELKPFTADIQTPALVLKDLKGKTHNLKDYKGQVVLVQFWATYCGPCRQEMPLMNHLMKKMNGVPFSILAVDMGESEAEVRQFVDEVKPAFTILLDEEGGSIADWKVFAVPSNFIIGPEGKIRYTLFGGVEWDSDDLVKKLKAIK